MMPGTEDRTDILVVLYLCKKFKRLKRFDKHVFHLTTISPIYLLLVIAILSSSASGSGKCGEVKMHQRVAIKEASVKITSKNLELR